MSMSISSSSGSAMPQVMSGASASMPSSQKMNTLFQQMGGTSNTLSQQQFTQAFNNMNPPAGFKAMGASTVFNKLDPNGTGSVSKQDFVSGMTSMMGKTRHHHHATGQAGATASSTATAAAANATVPSPAQSLSSSLQSLNTLSGQSAPAATGTTGALFNAVV